MLFWIIATALVCVLASAFGLVLMRRPAQAGASAAEHDMRVYRDQLQDLERDVARGVMAADDATRMRVEIARRMLTADRMIRTGQGPGLAAGAAPRATSWLALAAVVLVLTGGVGAYLRLGAPGYADQPLRDRLAAADALYRSRPTQDMAEQRAAATRPAAPDADPRFLDLMRTLRATLAQRPDDETGLALLARNEMILGNFHAGWQAQVRLITAKGDRVEAEDYARLGEDMTIAAGGLVTPEAEDIFAKALSLDIRNGRARYYMGLLMAQNGRGDRAFVAWDALLRAGPADAPWIAPIRQNITALAWLAGVQDYTPPNAPASTAAVDFSAAQGLSPEDRTRMIRSMVDGLAARLTDQGGPPDDWARLIAALRVLGETDRAARITAEARGIFANDPEALRRIDTAFSAPSGAIAPQEPTP